MLKANQIFKSYNDTKVLKGVTLKIEKGEIVSIIGASGAGKSTLLQILGTLDNADSGYLEINNEDITKLKGNKLSNFRNRNIGFVFQFHHLLPEFTALENVCIPGWISGEKKSEVEKHAKELMDIMKISHRFSHKPNQLSGGEQQRVAIARALINNPALVLADEPTGNLDSANSIEIYNLIAHLKDTFQQTFIIVTHNTQLTHLGNRLLEMKDGIIVS